MDTNLISISTKSKTHTGIYILNTITGALLYHTALQLATHISMVLCENWFVATYTSQNTQEALVLEFYESGDPNVRDER